MCGGRGGQIHFNKHQSQLSGASGGKKKKLLRVGTSYHLRGDLGINKCGTGIGGVESRFGKQKKK